MAALLAAVVALPLVACTADDPDRPPHVVIVVVDTLRRDRCSVAGYERPTTPGMEALASEAVVFERCWSAAPWTGPSHATIFTGLRPEHHGYLRSLNDHLPDEADTLAERLAEAGYETRCFSANPNVSPVRHLIQGFQSYVASFREAAPEERDGALAMAGRPFEFDPPGTTCDRALQATLESDRRGRSAFTFVNLLEPHLTYDPPEEASRHLVRPVDRRLEAWARWVQFPESAAPLLGVRRFTEREWAVLSDLYDAEVYTADAAVHGLVEGLRDAGVLDRTLLVVTSDHGEMLGEHGLADHFGHLRPELLQVPLIVRWPGGRDGGLRVHEVVGLEDITPTVLAECGLPAPADLDGLSLATPRADRISWAAVDPARGGFEIVEQVYPGCSVAPLKRAYRSVTDGRWHLLKDDLGAVSLWDLEADPRGLHDLSAEQPEQASLMLEQLHRAYPGW